jgi:hypothetical protein
MRSQQEYQAALAKWQATVDSPEWADCHSLCAVEAMPQRQLSRMEEVAIDVWQSSLRP